MSGLLNKLYNNSTTNYKPTSEFVCENNSTLSGIVLISVSVYMRPDIFIYNNFLGFGLDINCVGIVECIDWEDLF